jgi:hypothetical protein
VQRLKCSRIIGTSVTNRAEFMGCQQSRGAARLRNDRRSEGLR